MNAIRWTLYYATQWPEAIAWCFGPVVRFLDGQIKWERSKGLRP